MRVLKYDKDEGVVKLIPDHVEDLWHIERVIEPGDLVAAKSWRRFKTAEGESGEKKEVFVQLSAEQVEFSEHANKVRVTGRIVAGGPEEFVQLGSYHTIDIEPGFPVEIKKKEGWLACQLDRLYEAQKAAKHRAKLCVVTMDEKEASFASIREYGVSFDFKVESHASKREADYAQKQLQYYGDIAKALADSKADRIIVAGPGFAKDNLKKFLQERNPELLKRIVFETASTAEPSGVYELLKRGIIAKVVGEERLQKEFALMEEFMLEVSKDSGLAVYGISEVKKALEYGALKHLLITDELLRKRKEVEDVLEEAERMKVPVHIFSIKNPPGKQLEGLGGLAGLLRFRIS